MSKKKNAKKTRGRAKKKGARASTAKRGSTTRKLSAHTGVDFKTPLAARAFAMKAKKAFGLKKTPEVRRVESTRATFHYVVVLPAGKDAKKKVSTVGRGKAR